jgi:hypothetical protein
MHEQRDQDDDRDGDAEKQQKNRTHGDLGGEVKSVKWVKKVKGGNLQASRRRPPKVADKLATNAPMSSDTNSHSAL